MTNQCVCEHKTTQSFSRLPVRNSKYSFAFQWNISRLGFTICNVSEPIYKFAPCLTWHGANYWKSLTLWVRSYSKCRSSDVRGGPAAQWNKGTFTEGVLQFPGKALWPRVQLQTQSSGITQGETDRPETVGQVRAFLSMCGLSKRAACDGLWALLWQQLWNKLVLICRLRGANIFSPDRVCWLWRLGRVVF